MKKRKFNILLNIAVLCMCVCAIAIGVYSAKTASLNVSGTIGFTAHNCKVRVLGKITGAMDANNVALDPATTPALNYQESENKGKLIDGTADTWNFGSIFFDDLNTDKNHEVNDIVFIFTITNESAYYVDVTVNPKCSNNDRIFIYAPNNGENLAPGATITLTVNFQLKKVNGEYSSLNSAISLSNATLLNFTKSHAPSYLAIDWQDKITTDFSISNIKSATKISFVKEINDIILNGFDKNGETYKTVSVGAADEELLAGGLTGSVSDVTAYYNSTNKEMVIYSPARIYAPQDFGIDCGSMFSSYRALTSLDVSSFDTSKVTDMSSMFSYCSELKTIYVNSSKWVISPGCDTDRMFNSCGCSTVTPI